MAQAGQKGHRWAGPGQLCRAPASCCGSHPMAPFQARGFCGSELCTPMLFPGPPGILWEAASGTLEAMACRHQAVCALARNPPDRGLIALEVQTELPPESLWEDGTVRGGLK